MKEKKRLIIFDMDGTILDSTAWVEGAYKYTFRKCGLKYDKKTFKETSGMPLKKVYRIMLPGKEVGRFVKVHEKWQRENLGMVKPYKKAKAVLEKLSKKYSLGLWTGSRKVIGKGHLVKYKLDKLFKMKLFAEDTRLHKPKPFGIRKIMKRLGVKPKETVYVGDSINDLRAGKAAGVTFISSLYGVGGKSMKRKAKPGLSKFENILNVMKRLG